MELTCIRTFDNYFSANIILTRMQDAGIECYLFDENTVTVNPILGGVIGGIKFMVPSHETEAAKEMLRLFDEEYLRSAQCPKCGANDIQLVPKQGASNMLTSILTWAFSSYALSIENVYQCQHCGYESKKLPENLEALN